MNLRCEIDNLEPEMVVNEDIYDGDNVLMLARGTVLTRENIESIKKLGVRELDIYRRLQFKQPVLAYHLDQTRVRDFKHQYARSRNEFKGLIKYISSGNQVNVDQAYRIPGALLSSVGSTNNLFAYLNHVDGLDDHTLGHSINVALICAVIGNWFNLNKDDTKKIVVAGLLHDVGKSLLPPMLLNKAGLFTPEEWVQVKKHPIHGYRILHRVRIPKPMLVGALMHHEREDGSGYPFGVSQGKIPMSARFVALADIYDAMTSNRCYRNSMSPFKVIRLLLNNYYGVLHTGILMTFLSRIAECYVGEMVRLTDGRVGKVVFINSGNPARPVVQLTDGFINLEETTSLDIDSLLTVG
ncbi:MAG: HD-GYP domain-containing protein [Firmicutes bacterium]|nr:HD-GYP domain-containing protein [Bacillota bacterium]